MKKTKSKKKKSTSPIKLILFFSLIFLVGINSEVGEESSPVSSESITFQERNYNLYFEEDGTSTWKNAWNKTDVNSLIQINKEEDILSKRTKLIEYIWKGEFPTKLPNYISRDHIDEEYMGFESLESLDVFRIDMEHDVNSIVYHFKSHNSNGNLIIYVHGHAGGFINNKKAIEFFLDNNYDVIAFSMPLKGMNNRVQVNTEKFGHILLADHNTFFYLETEEFSPIKYFVHPIATVLNYLEDDYDTIAMTGLSGGGWTTTLYSALDPRIDKSYPAAGSHPIFLFTTPLRHDSSLGGDYEFFVTDMYNIANFLELYILGSHGEGRNQIQILNEFDDCCYAGIGYLSYEDIVASKVSSLGEGKFEVFSDNTHSSHNISEVALQVILEDLE